MFKHYCILFTALLLSVASFAQYTLLPTAVTMPVTLAFPMDVSNCGSVAYNPTTHLYYTSRIGNATYPLLTFAVDGTLLDSDTTGQDTRGIWWNPNTNQLERNNVSAVGWAKIDLDANNYAENTFSVIFSGMLQPNVQSVGAYDPVNNQVIFYNSGSISKYNRNTGTLISTTPITGMVIAGISLYTVVYTGAPGMEYGILDNTNQKIILLNAATCAYAGESQLPAGTVTASQYQFSYSNNLVWLFNTTTNIWHSFKIFDVTLLPIHDIVVSGVAQANNNLLTWEVIADEAIKASIIENSVDGINFTTVGNIGADADYTSVYTFLHENPAKKSNYYRVKCYDENDKEFVSKIICIEPLNTNSNINIYPNPAANIIVVVDANNGDEYAIVSSNNQNVLTGVISNNGAIDISKLKQGIYFVIINGVAKSFIKQ